MGKVIIWCFFHNFANACFSFLASNRVYPRRVFSASYNIWPCLQILDPRGGYRLKKFYSIWPLMKKECLPSFSPICYYWFIFCLLWISVGLSTFGFNANEYKQIAFWSLLTIYDIQLRYSMNEPEGKQPTICHYLLPGTKIAASVMKK